MPHIQPDEMICLHHSAAGMFFAAWIVQLSKTPEFMLTLTCGLATAPTAQWQVYRGAFHSRDTAIQQAKHFQLINPDFADVTSEEYHGPHTFHDIVEKVTIKKGPLISLYDESEVEDLRSRVKAAVVPPWAVPVRPAAKAPPGILPSRSRRTLE